MAQRAHMAADPGKVERLLVRPTPEGVAAMFRAITGRNVSTEDMARLAGRIASPSN
jgi:hypothetical protein